MEPDVSSPHEWGRFPDVESALARLYEEAVQSVPELFLFHQKLKLKTSSSLFQWIDSLSLPLESKERWSLLGFQRVGTEKDVEIYRHPEGIFPVLNFWRSSHKKLVVAVEDISLFLLLNQISSEVSGSFMSKRRIAEVAASAQWIFEVAERRGEWVLFPEVLSAEESERRRFWKEKLRMRPRRAAPLFEEGRLFEVAERLFRSAVVEIGAPMAATLFLEVEREFWQAKNRAGQIQFARQNSLGLGWANHDHHTFRSSRAWFQRTRALFEILGFARRECFWAGKEAGWGAQVLEHPIAKGVIFLDVDVGEDEIGAGLAAENFVRQIPLKTIGLWCALHGESILDAGMHHLEAEFSFGQLESDLKALGIGMMAPFSSFSYLKQAFTVGERWGVAPERIEALVSRGDITPNDAKRFLQEGAIGSHLENLERKEGYRGFNKNNVSHIIAATDPRIC